MGTIIAIVIIAICIGTPIAAAVADNIRDRRDLINWFRQRIRDVKAGSNLQHVCVTNICSNCQQLLGIPEDQISQLPSQVKFYRGDIENLLLVAFTPTGLVSSQQVSIQFGWRQKLKDGAVSSECEPLLWVYYPYNDLMKFVLCLERGEINVYELDKFVNPRKNRIRISGRQPVSKIITSDMIDRPVLPATTNESATSDCPSGQSATADKTSATDTCDAEVPVVAHGEEALV